MKYYAGLYNKADLEKARKFIEFYGGFNVKQDLDIPLLLTFEYEGKDDITDVETPLIRGFSPAEEKVFLVKTMTESWDLGIPVLNSSGSSNLVQQAHKTIGINDNSYQLRGEGVDVFVVDTGVKTHYDLPEVKKCKLDGEEFPWEDDQGHGTHVAGTIVSAVYGIADKANLYSVKVLDSSGLGTIETIVNGIKSIMQTRRENLYRPAVANMSFAGTMNKFNPITIAVEELMSEGCIVVAAAGNSGTNLLLLNDVIPAEIPGVITVSAVDNNKKMASFSNFGPFVEASAPGVNIASTFYMYGYTTMSGTSMAAPHVSGVIAAVLSTVKHKMYSRDHVDAFSEWFNKNAVVQDEEMEVPENSEIRKLLLNGSIVYGSGFLNNELDVYEDTVPKDDSPEEPIKDEEPITPPSKNKRSNSKYLALAAIIIIAAFIFLR